MKEIKVTPAYADDMEEEKKNMQIEFESKYYIGQTVLILFKDQHTKQSYLSEGKIKQITGNFRKDKSTGIKEVEIFYDIEAIGISEHCYSENEVYKDLNDFYGRIKYLLQEK